MTHDVLSAWKPLKCVPDKCLSLNRISCICSDSIHHTAEIAPAMSIHSGMIKIQKCSHRQTPKKGSVEIIHSESVLTEHRPKCLAYTK